MVLWSHGVTASTIFVHLGEISMVSLALVISSQAWLSDLPVKCQCLPNTLAGTHSVYVGFSCEVTWDSVWRAQNKLCEDLMRYLISALDISRYSVFPFYTQKISSEDTHRAWMWCLNVVHDCNPSLMRQEDHCKFQYSHGWRMRPSLQLNKGG